VNLGQLTAHHRLAVAAVRGGQLGQRASQPAACLEVDLSAAVGRQLGEAGGTLALAAGREALEAEPVGGQTGHGQRGRHRGRTRQRRHPQARRSRRDDQPVAGITDRRGARVGDEQDVLARLQLVEQAGRPARLDRVVVGHHARLELDVQAGREPAHPPGVLGRDQGGLGELGGQPGRCVFGAADGHRRQRQQAARVSPALRFDPLASRHVRIASCSSAEVPHIIIRLAGPYLRSVTCAR
jgi:hypothetical protein